MVRGECGRWMAGRGVWGGYCTQFSIYFVFIVLYFGNLGLFVMPLRKNFLILQGNDYL